MADNEKEQTQEQLREHVRENVQTLHGFIMVLAIGNAIRQLATRHSDLLSSSDTLIFPPIDVHVLASFVIGLILIFRFFMGDRLVIKNYDPANGFLFFVDMLNIFLSSIFVAYISFFVVTPLYFYLVFAVLLVSELLWWGPRWFIKLVFSNQKGNIADKDRFTIGLGQSVGIATVGWLYFYGLSHSEAAWYDLGGLVVATFVEENLSVLVWIFGFNTVADLIINGPRYFGSKRRWIISNAS